jgi:hypothetical protein
MIAYGPKLTMHLPMVNGLSNALEVALAPCQETDIRARDQILHGPGHEALVRFGNRRDSRRDVYCNTSHIVVAKFDLTRVKPGPNFDAERPD